jgi:hypothetical protein
MIGFACLSLLIELQILLIRYYQSSVVAMSLTTTTILRPQYFRIKVDGDNIQ